MATEKLIDANEVKKKLRVVKEWFNGYPSDEYNKLAQAVVKMCIEEIGKIKASDAVEVIRCKDCKHWKPSGSMAGNSEDDLQPIGGCEWTNCCRKANDFCSFGEKIAEDGK